MPLLDGAMTYWNTYELDAGWPQVVKSPQKVMVTPITLPPNASSLNLSQNLNNDLPFDTPVHTCIPLLCVFLV